MYISHARRRRRQCRREWGGGIYVCLKHSTKFPAKNPPAKTVRPMEYVSQISLQTAAAAATYFYISDRDASIRDTRCNSAISQNNALILNPEIPFVIRLPNVPLANIAPCQKRHRAGALIISPRLKTPRFDDISGNFAVTRKSHSVDRFLYHSFTIVH